MSFDPAQQAIQQHQRDVEARQRWNHLQSNRSASGGSKLSSLLVLGVAAFLLYKNPELVGEVWSHVQAWVDGANLR